MSEDEGFFSRWSRRKVQRRVGEASPAKPHDAPRPAALANTPPIDTPQSPARPVQSNAEPQVDAQSPDATTLPPPTLADVALLTPTSDFSRFVGAGVDQSVQHAALKTLFSDPHFNVMDGLDTYIGDYSTPNPIPDAMRRRLLESGAMRLFDALPSGADGEPTPAESEKMTLAAASPDSAPVPALPQSAPASDIATAEPEPEPNEDIALRLQPDDAADAAGAGSHRPGPRA